MTLLGQWEIAAFFPSLAAFAAVVYLLLLPSYLERKKERNEEGRKEGSRKKGNRFFSKRKKGSKEISREEKSKGIARCIHE